MIFQFFIGFCIFVSHGFAMIFNPKMHTSFNDGFHASINTMPISNKSAATFKSLWGNMGWNRMKKKHADRLFKKVCRL